MKFWFKAKKYGYGWAPANIYGALTLLVYATVVILDYLYLKKTAYLPTDAVYEFIPHILWLTCALLTIVFITGEKPRWQWGKEKKLAPISRKTRMLVGAIAFLILGPWVAYISIQPPIAGDWQTQLAKVSTAEFNNNLVKIHNIRNFRYFPTELDPHPDYYDKTYDLNELSKVWYITEPFKGEEYAGHTFLSFEFTNGDFVSLTIEGRKTKDQHYNPIYGLFKYYPLIYIAADERDTVLLRANIRKDDVFVYPLKATPEMGKQLFVDMLGRMNSLSVNPVWYNTILDSCTTAIVHHVNRVSPNTILLSWKLIATGYADELALDLDLIDTDLPLEQARQKYRINELSEKIGDQANYSKYIRGEQ